MSQVSKNPLRNPYNLSKSELRKRYNKTTPLALDNQGNCLVVKKENFKNTFHINYVDDRFQERNLGNFSFNKKEKFNCDEGELEYLGDIPTSHPYLNPNKYCFSLEDVLYAIPQWVYDRNNHVYVTTTPIHHFYSPKDLIMSSRHIAKTHVWIRKNTKYNLRSLR